MKTFTHVLYTWLLANMIHSFIWAIVDKIAPSYGIGLGANIWSGILLVFFYSFLLSTTAIFIAWPICTFIVNTNRSSLEKLCLWILLGIAAALISAFLVLLIIPGVNIAKELPLVIPALLSALFSISIRSNYFLNLTNNQQELN